MKLRCEDLMKRPRTVRPEDSLCHAARVMRETGVGFLPVCEDDQIVLGALTDRDIVVRACAERRDPASTTVREVMSLEVIACAPDDRLERCEALMAQHRKSRMMICDEGRLLGVISLSDVAQLERAKRVGKTMREVTAREVTA